MELYDQIFKRKSTRKYTMDPLPRQTLANVESYARTVKPLIEGIRTDIRLADGDDVRGMFVIKAPHYVLIYSEPKEGFRENAGFMLQQIDLYLSSLDLGSCWLGMAKAKLADEGGMSYVIMIGFGQPSESPHRSNVSEFTRKPLAEVASGDDPRFEAARLAPSAGNTQPWLYRKTTSGIEVFRQRFGMIKNTMYGTMNQVDTGIGLCHLWLASEHMGLPFAYTHGGKSPADVPQGFQFIGRIE